MHAYTWDRIKQKVSIAEHQAEMKTAVYSEKWLGEKEISKRNFTH